MDGQKREMANEKSMIEGQQDALNQNSTTISSTMMENDAALMEQLKSQDFPSKPRPSMASYAPLLEDSPAHYETVFKVPVGLYFWNSDVKPSKWVPLGHCRLDLSQEDLDHKSRLDVYAIPFTGRSLFTCSVGSDLEIKCEKEAAGSCKLTLSMYQMQLEDNTIGKLRVVLLRIKEEDKAQDLVTRVEAWKKNKTDVEARATATAQEELLKKLADQLEKSEQGTEIKKEDRTVAEWRARNEAKSYQPNIGLSFFEKAVDDDKEARLQEEEGEKSDTVYDSETDLEPMDYHLLETEDEDARGQRWTA